MSFTRQWNASHPFGEGATDKLSFSESGNEIALGYQSMPLNIADEITTAAKTKAQKITLSDTLSTRASASRNIFP